jgi:ferrous iron transport protein B
MPLIIALAGNPNAGKTTVFNGLTGLRQRVANYPGVTVERKSGTCALPDGSQAEVIDLPGAYSLVSTSPDEQVAMEVLRGQRSGTAAPNVVIAVLDAANLPRHLFLLSQLIDLGRPLVVALNCIDIAERRGIRVDVAALERALGVPVVPVVGHRRTGIDALRAAILKARVPTPQAWPWPEAFVAETRTLPVRLLVGDPAGDLAAARTERATDLAAAQQRLAAAGVEPVQADIAARYQWADALIAATVTSDARRRTVSDRADAVLVHPVAGLGIFALIMALVFLTVFTVAGPLQDWCSERWAWLVGQLVTRLPDGLLASLVSGVLGDGVGAVVPFVPQIALLFICLGILEDSGYLARAAFLMDRLLSRLGLHGKSFVPLLTSFACAIPGILATRTITSVRERLATILVAPFMSCGARLPVYILIIDVLFAEQPGWVQALIFLGCYALGILAAVFTALLFRLVRRAEAASPFILELPTYKLPQPTQVLTATWLGVREFLVRAGTIIMALSVVLWGLKTFPQLPEAERTAVEARAAAAWDAEHPPQPPQPVAPPEPAIIEESAPGTPTPSPTRLTHEPTAAAEDPERAATIDRAIAGAEIAHSAYGRLGHAIEPVIAPLGFDWKIGVGLVGAFAAREVFVATIGMVYGSGREEAEDSASLHAAMRAERHPDGRAVWTPLTGAVLLIWFVLAMQCISTTVVVRRETGTWRWALAQLVYMNVLAWVTCLAVYQLGTRVFGW